MIAESLNIPRTVVLRILKEDLGKRKLCARFVSHSLTLEQREDILEKTLSRWPMKTKNCLTKLLLEMRPGVLPMNPKQNDRFLNGLVSHPPAEETEIPKVPHQDHVDKFFDSQGVVNKEFVPEGKTVNAEFYKGVMDRLLKRIQRVRPTAYYSRDFALLHDNAPAHKAAIVCQFLTPQNVTTLYPPLYSPDLSPSDYFLFLKWKMRLKGLNFASVADIQEAVTDELKKVQKEEFSTALQKLNDRGKAYIYANGVYFEYKKGCVFDF